MICDILPTWEKRMQKSVVNGSIRGVLNRAAIYAPNVGRDVTSMKKKKITNIAHIAV